MTTKTNAKNLEIADAWIAFKEGMDDDLYAFGRHAFHRLAAGDKPSVAQTASATANDIETANEYAQQLQAWGLMTIDKETREITGAYGLSSIRTEYKLQLGETALYAWCALDAVGIPAGLQRDARIEAPVRGTKTTVTLHTRNGSIQAPPSGVILSLPDPQLDSDIRQEVCPEIALHDEARAPQHERVALLSLAEAQALGRRMWPAA